MTHIIVFGYESGWRLSTAVDLDNPDDFIAGVIPSNQFRFDTSILDARFERFVLPPQNPDGCLYWLGPCHHELSRNPQPFYVVPMGTAYPQQLHIPVRKLLLAMALNISYSQFPSFRITTICDTRKCVAVGHMIPAKLRTRDTLQRAQDSQEFQISNAMTKAQLNLEVEELKKKYGFTSDNPEPSSPIEDKKQDQEPFDMNKFRARLEDAEKNNKGEE